MKLERYVSSELEKHHAKRRKRDEAEARRAEATSKALEQLDFSVLVALAATEDFASPGLIPDVGTECQEQSK